MLEFVLAVPTAVAWNDCQGSGCCTVSYQNASMIIPPGETQKISSVLDSRCKENNPLCKLAEPFPAI
jgi:hypothetical protein